MRRFIATMAGIALAAGMSVAPAQAAELTTTTSYSISAEAPTQSSADTNQNKPQVVQHAVLNAEDSAKATQPESLFADFTTMPSLLMLAAGVIIVGFVGTLSVRAAARASKEDYSL